MEMEQAHRTMRSLYLFPSDLNSLVGYNSAPKIEQRRNIEGLKCLGWCADAFKKLKESSC